MTTTNSEGGVELTDDERLSLCLWMAARHLDDDYSGNQWEDWPLLAESEWTLVWKQLTEIAKELRRRSILNPEIDPQLIAERLT